MDDNKLAAPLPPTLAESQAPTIAPSSASMSEKKAPSESDAISSDNVGQTDGTPGLNEKDNGITRQATAASAAGGKSLQQTRTREDGTEYPTGMKLGLISLALCLSVFLMALDNSIIATAIPKITDQFQSLPDVGWYGSGEFHPVAFPLFTSYS